MKVISSGTIRKRILKVTILTSLLMIIYGNPRRKARTFPTRLGKIRRGSRKFSGHCQTNWRVRTAQTTMGARRRRVPVGPKRYIVTKERRNWPRCVPKHTCESQVAVSTLCRRPREPTLGTTRGISI